MGFHAASPRTVKFSKIGAVVSGEVENVSTEMQMNFTHDNRPDGPRFDQNGNPVYTTVVTLIQSDDNGKPTRRVKLRAGDTIFTDANGKETSRTTSGVAAAIYDALTTAGLTDLEPGHNLTITYVADAEPEVEGYSPAKVYEAVVEA